MERRLIIGGPDHGDRVRHTDVVLNAYLGPYFHDEGPRAKIIKYHLFEESEFGPVFVYEELLQEFANNHSEAYGIPPIPAPETRLKMESQPALF